MQTRLVQRIAVDDRGEGVADADPSATATRLNSTAEVRWTHRDARQTVMHSAMQCTMQCNAVGFAWLAKFGPTIGPITFSHLVDL